MTTLSVGTRGSDLALRQTRWVVDRLMAVHPAIQVREVVIQTHGDTAPQQPIDAHWPVDGFVGAIEQALLRGDIDFAVHSHKDLPTTPTCGLVVAAIPPREVVHDVLVARHAIDVADPPAGFTVGTSSPRRAAQWRRLGDVQVRPIRGNVPTRIAKVERGELDGVILAAAGIRRLMLTPTCVMDLPVNRFVPAPAQGALAIQVREGSEWRELFDPLNDPNAQSAVCAERSFLRGIGAGCPVAAGALAVVDGGSLSLRAQLFSADGERCVDGTATGDDPCRVGTELAERLSDDLETAA